VVIKRRVKKKFEENSALSDLAFLLIIYFIVIAGFNINKGFLVNLPAKDSTRIVAREDILRYEIDAAGSIVSGGTAVDAGTVERVIRSGTARNPNLAVVLTISPEAPWQSVVTFVELAQKLRVESFSFKMKEAEG
jgi:biopolymer transport protein ExbD